MKTFFKKVLCVLLSCSFVFPFSAAAAAESVESDNSDGSSAGTASSGSALTQEDFLVTKGNKIYNRKGEEVVLHGVNLGSWLIQEDWLSPYEEVQDHYDILETLIERFGTEKAYELLNTYQDNWITEYDIDEIAAKGFNCVRVPFWYRNFYSDDNGTKILDENGEWDFHYLDWIVEKCSQRGIYVILDMHGAPGFQSDAPHSGKRDNCRLYEDSEEGEFFRTLADELWTAIAARFNGNPAVAMYDLLNEPSCDCDYGEVTRRKNNTAEYQRLYKAVRAVDSDHIITLECIWTAFALPHKQLVGFENVVYQVHFYQKSDFIFVLFVLLTKIYYPDTPLMMGEFYPLGTTTWASCFKAMEKLNYSWMLWTYKASGHGMWESDWVLCGAKDGFERARIKTDSYEEIARKWGECLNTDKGFQETGHFEKNVAPYVKAQNQDFC